MICSKCEVELEEEDEQDAGLCNCCNHSFGWKGDDYEEEED